MDIGPGHTQRAEEEGGWGWGRPGLEPHHRTLRFVAPNTSLMCYKVSLFICKPGSVTPTHNS